MNFIPATDMHSHAGHLFKFRCIVIWMASHMWILQFFFCFFYHSQACINSSTAPYTNITPWIIQRIHDQTYLFAVILSVQLGDPRSRFAGFGHTIDQGPVCCDLYSFSQIYLSMVGYISRRKIKILKGDADILANYYSSNLHTQFQVSQDIPSPRQIFLGNFVAPFIRNDRISQEFLSLLQENSVSIRMRQVQTLFARRVPSRAFHTTMMTRRIVSRLRATGLKATSAVYNVELFVRHQINQIRSQYGMPF